MSHDERARPGSRTRWTLAAWLAVTTATMAAEPVRFVDDSFEDFSAGTLVHSGQNLYIARDGTIRTINRFDLNDDGHLDLVFNCTHDTYQMLPATVGRLSRSGECLSSDLGVEGSQRVAVGDLNRDGHIDLVFCPNAIGVHHDRRFLSVAWGGPSGWSARRITSGLPMNRAANVAIVDLNHDRWPDIAVLGAARWRIDQPPGRIIRVFWGSPDGFSAAERQDYGVVNAVDIAAADFDRDGSADLAVLRSDAGVSLLWTEKVRTELAIPKVSPLCLAAGDADGDRSPDLLIGTAGETLLLVRSRKERGWEEVEAIPAFAASHVTVGRLDDDPHPDLVLTRFSTARAAGGEQAGIGKDARDAVVVLWGRPPRPGTGRFARELSTRIPVTAAVATAVGDLNGDRHTDLIVAVHQGQGTFNGFSRGWLGDGRRGLVPLAKGFATSGTTDVAVAHVNTGGRKASFADHVIFCNSIGGRYDEAVPVHVYWGGKDGFDPRRVWKIPFQSGYESSAADLNADGHVDLVLLNSGHSHTSGTAAAGLGANIYWGGPDGFDLKDKKRRSVIHEHFLGSSSVADLNRDGLLDLVLEPFAPEAPGKVDQLFIHYGTAAGFPKSRRRVFDKPGYSQEHVVADLNHDGWLDITHCSRTQDVIRILWGGKQGFSAERSKRIKLAGVMGMSAADLNADGRLDLYASTYNDPLEGFRDMGSTIFWGSRGGFRHSNAQWLPGFSPLGRTVADFDGDGYLDLFSPQHSGELTREDLACHIYWGSRDGFHTRRRTTLFCDSVNDSLAADFNGDGRIDLAVACHTQHGNHRVFSRVFYNDGHRFKKPKMTRLPTNGTHLMWACDVGNIADRSYRETFHSRAFSWQGRAKQGRLTVTARTPRGSGLELAVRTAASAGQLSKSPWRPLKRRTFRLADGDRCLQYRTVFTSDNGDRYPVLDRAEVTLSQ